MSAAARSDLPNRVRLMISVSAAMTTMAMAMAMPRPWLMKTVTKSPHIGPIIQAELETGVRMETSCGPNIIMAPFCRISETPSVSTSWA